MDFFAHRKGNKELNIDISCPVQWAIRNVIRQKKSNKKDPITVIFFHIVIKKGRFSRIK